MTDFDRWMISQEFWHENSRRKKLSVIWEVLLDRFSAEEVWELMDAIVMEIRDEYGD